MRHSPRVLLLVLLFVALAPRPAAASDMDWWRWWDSLSGPGPFNGVGYDSSLVSRGYHRDGLHKGEKGVFLDPTGLGADPLKLHVRVGVEWAILFAQKNNLPYAAPRDQNPPGVRAYPVVGAIDVGRRGVEVGAGIGAVWFAGDGFRFARFVVSPRVTLRPGLLFVKKSVTEPNKKLELLQIRIGLTGVIGEMTAKDFGAIGTFHGGNEWLPSTTISINLLALR